MPPEVEVALSLDQAYQLSDAAWERHADMTERLEQLRLFRLESAAGDGRYTQAMADEEADLADWADRLWVARRRLMDAIEAAEAAE